MDSLLKFLEIFETPLLLPTASPTVKILRIYNYCFKAETVSRTFNARSGTVGMFFMFAKTRDF